MQSQRAAGENISQQRKIDKASTLLGMSQQRLGAAKAAKAAATSSIVSGATGLLGGVAKGAILGAGMEGMEGKNFFQKMGAGLGAEIKGNYNKR
jgi:hypothetical protein